MQLGTYYHTIETTGRVSVPASFRSHLGASFIVSAGVDGNLNLFSKDSWQSFTQTLLASNLASRVDRDYLRLILHQAVEVEVDEHGRIGVPENLRIKAKLKKDVVFAGSMDHIELWDRDAYHAYMDALEARSVEASDLFSELHHG